MIMGTTRDRSLRSLVLASSLGTGACTLPQTDIGAFSPSSSDGSSASSSAPTTDGTMDASTSSVASTSTASTSTATGSPTDDGEDASASSTGCGFVCDPTGAPIDECVVGQDDCPDGSKCVWYSASPGQPRRDAAKCIPVTGDVPPFHACSLPNGIGADLTDDCDASSFCLEVYGSADHGFCAPFSSDGTCDEYPGSEFATENGSTFPMSCLYFECNPLVPDACPDGMQCTLYPAFLYGSLMCWFDVEVTPTPVGTACDYGGCGGGAPCLPAEYVPGCTHERCCTQWCDLGSPSCDDPEASCELYPAWNYTQTPGLEALGACIIPGAFDE